MKIILILLNVDHISHTNIPVKKLLLSWREFLKVLINMQKRKRAMILSLLVKQMYNTVIGPYVPFVLPCLSGCPLKMSPQCPTITARSLSSTGELGPKLSETLIR